MAKRGKGTFTLWVTDSKTGEWKPIEPEDIPKEKKLELCDRFARALGYKRNTAT
ncbi:MAG: hypothetical protein SPJ65_01955 [Roseburia sp.]|nr:hypothetical protein [Roseburia sp.]